MEVDTSEPLERLMARYQAGDGRAFDEIYQRTVGSLEAYLRRWTQGAPVSDLAQEVYLQVIRARRAYRPEVPFRPWLLAIARHVVQGARRTHARRWGREVAADAGLAVQGAVPAADLLRRVALERALAELPPEHQEIVWLAWVEGFTAKEIAAVTGDSPGAVKVRLHRIARRLRKDIGSLSFAPERGG